MKKNNRIIIFNKYLWKCAYCWCNIEEDSFEIDHFLPKHKDGADNYLNLMPACRNCNRAKKTYKAGQWREILQNKVNELKKFWAYNQAIKFWLVKETWENVKFYRESDLDYETIIALTEWIHLFED